MTAIAQTSMIAACLAVLIYVAVVVTGNYFATQENITNDQNPLSQQQRIQWIQTESHIHYYSMA
jgi:hypothetical protein